MWDLIVKARSEELHRQAERQRLIGEVSGRHSESVHGVAALGRWSKFHTARRFSILKPNGKLQNERGTSHV